MLARESLAIGEAVGAAMARALRRRVRARASALRHDLSATQERQDAVNELLEEPLDVMVVIGGFNSSNTISLAALCAERVPTYHIEDAEWHRPRAPDGALPGRRRGARRRPTRRTGCAGTGAVRVGITAGASTPNNKIGETVARIFADPRRIRRVDRVRVPFLSKPRKVFPKASDFGFLELHGGETRRRPGAFVRRKDHRALDGGAGVALDERRHSALPRDRRDVVPGSR